jgi:hypothetical protein
MLMTARISSQRYAVDDYAEALELCYRRGWTDGLPVVPPTEPAVRAMLDAAALEPDAQIAFITNRQVAISAEKVAINAVMAGCLPEHMPVWWPASRASPIRGGAITGPRPPPGAPRC